MNFINLKSKHSQCEMSVKCLMIFYQYHFIFHGSLVVDIATLSLQVAFLDFDGILLLNVKKVVC